MTAEPWVPNAVEFVSDLDRPELAVSPWAGHRWFAYDLVRWARPKRLVELGTHFGCSYFAFCQAVQADQSDCEVMAVDTWEGEEHTGLYGEEVFDTFTAILERRFATVRTRVQRSTFDEALEVVADQSVDILHIDGLHTYDAVSHDYETWKGKLAPNGIVLFHDVAPSSGYGSARFWQELRECAPGFAFMHSFGLGVLLPNGTEGREPLLELGQSPWRSFYEHRAGHDLRNRQVVDLAAMVEARDEALRATEALVVSRDEALAEAQALVAARDEALAATEKLVAARDEALAATEKIVVGRDQALIAAQKIVEGRNDQLQQARRLLAERDEVLAEARATLDRRDQELARSVTRQEQLSAELSQVIGERDREIERAVAATAAAEAEAAQLEHHIAALTIERDALAGALGLYRRALRPVRWAARPPRRVLRRIRGRRLPALEAENPVPEPVDPSPEVRSEPPRLFDAQWYLARYPDIGRAGVDPWSHWTTYGWKEGREPCPLFSAASYLEHNPDVVEAGVDPLTHWLESGWREGRDPSPLFSTDFYRERNAEHLAGDENPLDHYLATGLGLGLFVAPDHERRVLHDGPAPRRVDDLLVDVVVHHSDGTERSVPYSMIVDLDADLFTFDLWDSILTRSRPADAAKLATARRLRLALGLRPGDGPSTWDLMRRRVAIEAAIAGPGNGEYLLGDVLTRLLEEVVAEEGPARHDIPALANALRRAELEDEMTGTVPIGDTVLVIEKLLGRGDSTQVAVLSDFYLGGDDLRELLSFHGLGGERLQVVSSADTGCSKHRNGELFEWARQRLGVDATRHVHIGDNAHSDVAMQTATGGTAVHLVHGDRRFAGPGQLTEETLVDVRAELDAELEAAGRLRCRQPGLRPRPQNRVLLAAWRTALCPVALVAAAIEDAMARGLDRVHYLSREGLFLAGVHEEVAAILAPRPPDAVHLAVSRRSTFGPSLAEVSPATLLDLWRMYSRQTPRGLLVSLGADADDYAAAARRSGLELDEVIDGIHLDPRVRAFIEDREVAGRLGALNAERRAALLRYLRRQTDLDRDEMLVVDVGWRGTVQDNLARLLPDTRFVGWYLALFPFLNPQLDNCVKSAVGPDGNQGQEFSFMEPPAAVERPWTPAVPSVVDYRASGAGGSVPVLDEESLDADSRAAIALYQDAVIEAAPAVARWIVANGAATDVLRPQIERDLAAYYATPEPGIADLWFDTAHDDTFGVLNVTSFGKSRPSRAWFHDGVGPGFLRHLEDAAAGSLWPSGYRRWRPVEAAVVVERALRTQRYEPRIDPSPGSAKP